MPFQADYPTRHTDAFADTSIVHTGVLFALTEGAYADLEAHCGVSKPDHVVAMQRESRAVFHRPLPWRHGARIAVTTTEASERRLTQEFEIRSAAEDFVVATFVHTWGWIDLGTGRAVEIPEDARTRFLRDA